MKKQLLSCCLAALGLTAIQAQSFNEWKDPEVNSVNRSAMHTNYFAYASADEAKAQFLIDLTIFLFLLIALQPIYCSALLPLLIISNSILIGHFFVLTNSKSSNVFFIISLVGLILLFAFNIWTLL